MPTKSRLPIHIVGAVTGGLAIATVIAGLAGSGAFALPVNGRPVAQATPSAANGGVAPSAAATDVNRFVKADSLRATRIEPLPNSTSRTIFPHSERIVRGTVGAFPRRQTHDPKLLPSHSEGCEATASAIGHPVLERLIGRCYA